MAINRFNRPIQVQAISQFVPEDMNMIARVMTAKQARYDQQDARMEMVQDQMSRLTGYGQVDQGILKQAGEDLNKIATEYSNKDLSDPRIAKELRGKANAIANNPAVRATQQTMQSIQAWRDARAKIKDYRAENDIFASQLQNYQGADQGPLMFNGIIEGVDERKQAEEFFNNMPKSGQYNWELIGDDLKKVGWEGISSQRINQAVLDNVNSFAQTAAGRQAMRRYSLMNNQGLLPEGATPTKYLTSILASAGAERVGGISTGALGGGAGAGGSSSAYPSSRRSIGGPQFVPPTTRAIADMNLSFNEQGQVEGEGNATFKGWLMGKNSFWEAVTDDSLTPEEKSQLKVLDILSKQWNVTPKEAATQIADKTLSPTFRPPSTSEYNTMNKIMHNKGAGMLSHMTAISQDGTRMSGSEVLKQFDILNSDNEFNEDSKYSVNVMGPHDANTGVIPKGWHVDINGNYFIFEDTTPTPAEVSQYMKATAAAQGGVVEDYYKRGSYVYFDADQQNWVPYKDK